MHVFEVKSGTDLLYHAKFVGVRWRRQNSVMLFSCYRQDG